MPTWLYNEYENFGGEEAKVEDAGFFATIILVGFMRAINRHDSKQTDTLHTWNTTIILYLSTASMSFTKNRIADTLHKTVVTGACNSGSG